MRLLIDVGVGLSVERWCRQEGFNVLAVRDLNPAMPDSEIITLADEQQRFLITMDKDFGEWVVRHSRGHEGVLLLRMEGATGDEKANVVRQILTHWGANLVGRLAVYQRGRLRMRAVPRGRASS